VTVEVVGADGMRALVGEAVGTSRWHPVDQGQVDRFADATGDHQWIHVDAERAASSPFGSTIVHGYLTLSLIPFFMKELWVVSGFTHGVNYGCARVRFPAPVPVGSRLRCTPVVDAVTDVPGGIQVELRATIEIEGTTKPACVATVLYRYFS